MTKYYIDILNAAAKTDPKGFIEQSSENYISSITDAATIFLDKGKKIIMLAGPSSSGKTTTARIIREFLEKSGCEVYTVSLDDFYLPDRNDYPLNKDGSYNYESIYALDLDLIEKCFRELTTDGESNLPIFDFDKKTRSEEINNIRLGKDGVMIVEGIHGLNPIITDHLPNEAMARLYVSVSTRIFDRDGEILLRKRNLRLLRRMVRDNRFRSTDAASTLSTWKSVMAGEDNYIFPFRNHADIKLDSFHPCEVGLLAAEALPLLNEVRNTSNDKMAENMIEKLKRFRFIDRSYLEGDSLLYEFLGR